MAEINTNEQGTNILIIYNRIRTGLTQIQIQKIGTKNEIFIDKLSFSIIFSCLLVCYFIFVSLNYDKLGYETLLLEVRVSLYCTYPRFIDAYLNLG